MTTAGIEQHHRLGKLIRNRYNLLLSSNYTASEIVVRSTDVDRTLMSAQSNLVGLYPVIDPSIDTVPIQPIPIHTVSIDLDFVCLYREEKKINYFLFSYSVKMIVQDMIKLKMKLSEVMILKKPMNIIKYY